ncbi:hypothetical protein D3C86_1915860 [compost metagenome]
MPGVEVALQLRLTDRGRVLAVQHTQCICEQQAFARAFHDRVHQHGGVHLGAQVLQRVRQPAGQPLVRRFIVVAQKRNQPTQIGAGFVIPDRFER